ncbi:ATP-binding protein [Microbulbifer halophilus]|uniref:ATP-binding protein n=1 Tax=Microbulbifer halophilus TaxID=453963 RepID=A0ABW5EDI9_9GAMM|nr:RNA-binding domain-containing protein [Microbulbifer halophilus]MCW8127886.1 putative DNA binding domain-containing protein [Microbulbifer halophilus]
MLNTTPERLLQELRQLDEHPRIEAKRARDIGASVMQTVCAFANEPGLGGGYLLLGVSEPDETHDTYWLSGIEDTDKLLNALQSNCRDQFEQPVAVQCEVGNIEGQRIAVVFVPELEPAAKPCSFKGKFDSKNKRKTGVWRRGLNGDYECTQADLEPILLAKSGTSFEQVVLGDAGWDDLDPAAIELYRKLREKVRPHAEELKAEDREMLRALNLVKRVNDQWKPNLAGLLLLGKPLSLRRLLPAVRVDYVRIQGTQWVEDPEQRFATTIDFREPLLRLIPRLEAAILDDMPRHFRLREGETQRSDQPLVPQKVIREAIVNAVMHRDYQVNQPTLVVRYSNRLEVRNTGYSLKPEALLGEMGSALRNPILAAVLYDLEFAETKGSGIRTMRRLLDQAGLTAPVFSSDTFANQFSAVYLLHQLLGEEQLAWLRQFNHLQLSDDEAKALILARETGAVDNAALRSVTGLDTLSASQVLGRLHHQRHLLLKGGAGPATYYELARLSPLPLFDGSEPDANASELESNTSDLEANASDLRANASDLPQALRRRIAALTPKARQNKLWPVVLWLCALQPQTAESLATLLDRKVTHLKSGHLTELRAQGLLDYLHPEVINHPDQAYVTTEAGRAWLRQQGVDL